MATLPRRILPGKVSMITIRAIRRSFRFVPKKKVVELIKFCFALCAKDYNVAVHEFIWMSNHAHILLTDREGRLPDFVRDMNSLISRNLNALRGENGTNFEKGYNIVEEADQEAILKHASYILANPCSADLVAKAKHWQGLTSWNLEYGQEIEIPRPDFGIWTPPDRPKKTKRKTRVASKKCRWKTPESVTFKLERPPIFLDKLDDRQLRAWIRDETIKREDLARMKRKKAGRKVLGWNNVIRQRCDQTPSSREDMFGPEPRAAGQCKWARIEIAQRSMEFVKSYRKALKAFIDGKKAVFPFGTWKMRVQFQVPCAVSPL